MATIYSTTPNVRKDDAYLAMSGSVHAPNTFSSIDKKVHAFKKRILAHAFTNSALKGVEDRILSHVIKFCDTLLGDGKTSDPKPSNGSMGQKNSWGPIRDIATLSDYLAFDIISDLCYGKSFSMLQSDKFRSFTKITTTLSRRSAVVGILGINISFNETNIIAQCIVQPRLWRYKLDRIFFAGLFSPIKTFGLWIRQQAKIRTKLGSSLPQKDCFHYMLNAKDPKTGQPFTEKELWIESLQLIVAGTIILKFQGFAISPLISS